MKNIKDINKNIIEFNVNLLKSYLNFINIKEEIQIELINYLYKKILKNIFINTLIKYSNDKNMINKIKDLKKNYKLLAEYIYYIYTLSENEIKTYKVLELLLLKNIEIAKQKQLNDFYEELDKIKEIEEIFTLEQYFKKFALNIFIYNIYYNKKIDIKEGEKIIKKFIKKFNKNKYKNVGLDFNSNKIRILIQPYIEEFGNSLNNS